MKMFNIVKVFKDFVKNIKSYAEYLMKVDFGELFINVLILLCILILSCFAYIPSAIIKDILKGLITVFEGMFSFTGLYLFDWVFNVIGLFCTVVVFAVLFNMRFADIDEFKKQFEEKPKKEKKEDEVDKIDLPKPKKSK